MRTKEETQRQITGLKKMKEGSRYNQDVLDAVDAQLDVLEGLKKPDDFYIDESSEEFTDGDNETYFEAEKAERWMTGEENNDLFEEE